MRPRVGHHALVPSSPRTAADRIAAGRAFAFGRDVSRRSADRVLPHPAGALVLTPSLPLVYDANFLRVERWNGPAEDLLAEAERALADAGCAHRRVVVTDEELGERLRPTFSAAWPVAHHFLVMAQRRAPDRAAPDVVTVVEPPPAALEEARAAEARLQPWGRDEVVVRQLRERDRRQAAAVAAASFGVVDGGRVVSYATVYVEGGVAEIDDVATVEAYRGRGYARAVVLRCLEAAREAGAELVFLLADDGDWPKELYAKLGFDVVGMEHVFGRPHDAA
jgi:N-acetylglutamate synthase-like GNAT family acetyltransferase